MTPIEVACHAVLAEINDLGAALNERSGTKFSTDELQLLASLSGAMVKMAAHLGTMFTQGAGPTLIDSVNVTRREGPDGPIFDISRN